MSKRFQLLKNSIPIIIVTKEDVDKYYLKYDADQVVELDENEEDVMDKLNVMDVACGDGYIPDEESPAKMQGIIYVLVYYDIGETCDGHVRKLGQYASRDLAKEMLKSDMEYQLKQHPDWHACNTEVSNEDFTAGCVYDIIEVEY